MSRPSWLDEDPATGPSAGDPPDAGMAEALSWYLVPRPLFQIGRAHV